MSARSSITKALVEKFKEINGEAPYQANVFTNVVNKLKFWDEISDFPYLCVVPGNESREYLPGDFKWGYLGVSIKAYVKGEDPITELEQLLEDIELVVDANRQLVYGTSPGEETTEIDITSIVTDEGLLTPYGVGEVNLLIRYQVL